MDPIDRPTDSLLKLLLVAGEEEDAALLAGSKVGRYVVLERIGGGGMGVVYKAYDPQLDRAIALKLMRAAGRAGDDADAASARVLREAQALAKVAHPNVVAIHDVGMFGDQVFAAMEYVDGDALGAWRRAAERTPDEILAVFRDAGRGLAAAHAAGLAHRDFKPDNVIVGRDGRVRVLDFGLARGPGAAETVPAAAARPVDLRITHEGATIGTPAYMAPEQHQRRPADARSDQFAFCVALWEALYGQLPFAGDSVDALAEAVTAGRVREPPGDAGVPAWVRPVLLRGLAVDPAARHESMDALVEALDRQPRGRRRALLAAGALAAIGAVALVAVWRSGGDPDRCGGGAAELVGIWDPEVRSLVQGRFAASGQAHAEASFARVARVVDGQAAEWSGMHREICEARRDRRQDEPALVLRERCLAQRRDEMAELSRTLMAADATAVDRAVHAAFELSSVSACADPAALALAAPAAPRPVDPDACGVPAGGRYFPLEVGRAWVYDVIDKGTRRSRDDPKIVTVEGLLPVGGCKGDRLAYRVRQQQRQGHAFRWQEAIEVPGRAGRPSGLITIRHRDQWFASDGTPTKDEYYVPSRIRLDETCERSLVDATYLDAYDQVEVAPGTGCDEPTARERRTFDWKVVGAGVPLELDLDYRHAACCPAGLAACGPPADGPGHTCVAAGDRRWSCEFRTLQVVRLEVSGGTAATYWFAAGVGKVLEDEKGEDREVLTCFSGPGPRR